MDTAIITVYCLTDDWLRARRHQESSQRRVTDAEVMTAAIVAARFFSGNFETAQDLLEGPSYFGGRLSRSRFNRRLHALDSILEAFFEWLGQVHQMASAEDIFLIDSCPVEVCDNIRIDRCQIYPKTATDDAYRGYNSSKRRYFYGLKVHMVTTAEGNPVEVSLTPGSYSDTKHLRTFELDFPEGSVLYGDKAYNEYFTEDLLSDASGIELLPHRKKNSRRSVEAYVEYVQQVYRKKQENRNRIQWPETAATSIDSRGYRPRFRAQGVPFCAGIQHRCSAVGRNLSYLLCGRRFLAQCAFIWVEGFR